MERIERDLNEISGLRATLQDDREYTARLRTSLQDETIRLRELQTKILAQVIHSPPEKLIPLAGSRPTRAAAEISPATRGVSDDSVGEVLRPPEIIVPATSGAATNRAPAANRPAKPKRAATGEAAKPGANSGNAPDGDESFNFTFIQK